MSLLYWCMFFPRTCLMKYFTIMTQHPSHLCSDPYLVYLQYDSRPPQKCSPAHNAHIIRTYSPYRFVPNGPLVIPYNKHVKPDLNPMMHQRPPWFGNEFVQPRAFHSMLQCCCPSANQALTAQKNNKTTNGRNHILRALLMCVQLSICACRLRGDVHDDLRVARYMCMPVWCNWRSNEK